MISIDDADPQIGALYVAWADAFRRQDVETILSLLTPDYVLWAPGAPAIDRIGLRPALLAAFAANDITSAFECEERLVSGDLAFDRGWDTQTIKPRAAGECQSHRHRVFLLLRRSSDGRWQFARGMSHQAVDQCSSYLDFDAREHALPVAQRRRRGRPLVFEMQKVDAAVLIEGRGFATSRSRCIRVNRALSGSTVCVRFRREWRPFRCG